MTLVLMTLLYATLAKIIYGKLVEWPSRDSRFRTPDEFTRALAFAISFLWILFLPTFIVAYGFISL